MAEEQLKFKLRHDQDKVELQSAKEAHNARMEQFQRQLDRQEEEIRKKAAGMFPTTYTLNSTKCANTSIGSRTNWGTWFHSCRTYTVCCMLLTKQGSVFSVGGKPICTVADVAGKVFLGAIEANLRAEAAQAYDEGVAHGFDYATEGWE